MVLPKQWCYDKTILFLNDFLDYAKAVAILPTTIKTIPQMV